MQDSISSGYQDPGSQLPKGTGRPSGKTRFWLAAVGAALVAGLVAGYLVHGSSTAVAAPQATKTVAAPVAGLVPTDSTSATPTESATTTSDATATGSPGASTGPNATGLGTVSLVDLTPASSHFDNSDAKPTLNGQLQTFALSDNISGTCGYPGPIASNDVGYDLGRNYTQFTAVFGIDDTSPDETVAPQIEIDGDGLKLANYTPKLGHSAQATLNITGVLRLDIKWSINGGCHELGHLVIGNAQLTTVPGYDPSPAASQN